MLKLTIRHGADEMDFVNAQLKSKLLTYPGGRFSPRSESEGPLVAHFALLPRVAEAAPVRELENTSQCCSIRAVTSSYWETSTTVRKQQRRRFHVAAPAARARGPDGVTNRNSGFKKPDAGDAQRLCKLALVLEEEPRWARRYAGQNELIDHILASTSSMHATPAAPCACSPAPGPGRSVRRPIVTYRTRHEAKLRS